VPLPRSRIFRTRQAHRFERLMQAWLATDLQYTYCSRNFWLQSEFPACNNFSGKDADIELER